MHISTEAQQFIDRIVALPEGPGVKLDDALAPSIEEETQLRRLFATDRSNPRIADPYVGLVDIFAAPAAVRTTRARVISNEADKNAQYVLPLEDDARRKEGEPSTAVDMDEFRRNWAIFTEGALSQLTDWSNVIAAGGSVLGCLLPLPEYARESKRTVRKFYHSAAYPTSDIDLFLYGMTPEQVGTVQIF